MHRRRSAGESIFDMSESPEQPNHITVLKDETVELLKAKSGSVFVDATLGLGGHTEAILDANPKATVIGIDQDASALAAAKERLGEKAERVRFVHASFTAIAEIVAGREIDGVIADLGVSSMQIDSEQRGFSFRYDAPLDMRMNQHSDVETAADLLERLSSDEIANIVYQYGEERGSRKIARRIVEARESGNPVRTTFELKRIIESSIRWNRKDPIHPATRTFQALRIAVNDELGSIERFLKDAISVLQTGGRLAVISFHSLEDRIVKQTFLRLSGKCSCPPRMPVCVCGAEKLVDVITRKPVVPGPDEIQKNPRSRSAKLRVAEKAV